MGIIAFDVNQTWDYSLKRDQSPEDIQKALEAFEPPNVVPLDEAHIANELRERLKTATPKTVFHLGHLDSALATYLMDSVADYKPSDKGRDGMAAINFNVFQRDRELVRYGVRGWTGLPREDGAMVEPRFVTRSVGGKVGTRKGLADESLDLLMPDFAELAAAIEAGNKMTEAQIKNS